MSRAPGIAGTGPAERREAVLAAIDGIVDPCSEAVGHPVGLVAMGMIERLDVTGGSVLVSVLPTFPACLFQGKFEEEIEARVGALPWCDGVAVRFIHGAVSWDETRMSPRARALLGRRRAPSAASAP
ncbi:MAG: iron-sulfur cluster assembly protein [Alsobacter sp.]